MLGIVSRLADKMFGPSVERLEREYHELRREGHDEKTALLILRLRYGVYQ